MVTARALLGVIALPVFAAGCFNPTFRERIACDTNGACPDGLRCGPDQICGSDGAPDDAHPGDGAAASCFGAGVVRVCLAASPAAALTISDKGQTIDTGDATMCAVTISGADDYCVVAATTIAVSGTLHAKGPKPLVLLASDVITVTQLIDVASHRTNPEFIGAGADPPQLCGPGAAPGLRGGGAGGSFTGTGGAGGAAPSLGGGVGGAPAAPVTIVNQLRGGCPGQTAGTGGLQGGGGHGGGAVFLIAGTRIDITGPGIDAGGEGGGPGAAAGGDAAGAGGGGSGGMIGLDAPLISCSAALVANGGGGGEGSGNTNSGSPGADATVITAASGGVGGSITGGDGGNGSSGPAAGAGANGRDSVQMGGNNSGGGGGGGGGAGIIKGPAAALGTQVSPAATP